MKGPPGCPYVDLVAYLKLITKYQSLPHYIGGLNKESVLFVGSDVCSKTISLCTYDPICNKYSYEAKVDNDIKFIWKYAKNTESSDEPGTKLVFGY